MRLAKLIIRNFKSIRELELTIPKTDQSRPGSADFLSIVGENNVGKSSVLEALCLACPEVPPIKPTDDHFPEGKIDGTAIEVELEFDSINSEDLKEPAIHPNAYNNRFRIKKVWNKPSTEPTCWAYKTRTRFPTWPDNARKRIDLERASGWNKVIDLYEQAHGKITNITAALRTKVSVL
ncbi:AAA family ATPase [Sorangium sp. So ce1036]|uniref:AAA family ATPase n=1 Tax=Sorangium sp. So ce1036 TaxID=3133328 RepID=UPI003F04798E